jgi:pectate lyase
MVSATLLLFACSNANESSLPKTTGGSSTNNGGVIGTGGLASLGGRASSGGTVMTGDAGGTGGATSSGGNFALGGMTANGGGVGTGGLTSSGGSNTQGGTAVSGGVAGTGGTTGSGGVAATGGIHSGTGGTGGAPSGGDCPLTLEGFASLNAEGTNGVSGGGAGQTVTVTTQADLERYATADEPYTIRVQGTVKLAPKGTEIRVKSNKTIIGVGTTGTIDEGGFFLNVGVQNVIIRNLTIGNTRIPSDTDGKEFDFDGIQMDTAHHIWIDHCNFHNINDGMIDSRKDTTYLTVSWNILHDHNKTFGIGWTPNVTAQITIHHNILRDTTQRNPSTDNVLRAHLYNNWMLRLSSYGNYSRGGTNMVIENSVFDQVYSPHYFDTGSLVAIGNIYRDVGGRKESSGDTYSFFDPNKFYKYTLNPTSEVEALLTKCAGPRPELGQ